MANGTEQAVLNPDSFSGKALVTAERLKSENLERVRKCAKEKAARTVSIVAGPGRPPRKGRYTQILVTGCPRWWGPQAPTQWLERSCVM